MRHTGRTHHFPPPPSVVAVAVTVTAAANGTHTHTPISQTDTLRHMRGKKIVGVVKTLAWPCSMLVEEMLPYRTSQRPETLALWFSRRPLSRRRRDQHNKTDETSETDFNKDRENIE